ncbi:MAG: 2-oxo-tetronate isomerase [Vibrio sp.]
MTQFVANLTMLFTEVPFLQRFERAYHAGFTAVEYLFPYAYDATQLAEQLDKYGFTQALFNMPPGDWEAGERGLAALPERQVEFQDSVHTALHYALTLHCKKVHAMAGLLDPTFSYQEHVDTFIRNMRFAADIFAEHNIDLMIEPLNSRDVPGYFVTRQYDAIELIQRIDRPNVKLQLDLYHAQIMEGDLSMLIGNVAEHIGHIQIASVPERHEPCDGELNYSHLFKVLEQAGYASWIGCEYNPKRSTEDGLHWLQPYL